MRTVLDSLGIEHHTLTRLDETGFIFERAIKQAVATQAPVALILSPLLTGVTGFANPLKSSGQKRLLLWQQAPNCRARCHVGAYGPSTASRVRFARLHKAATCP